ncbi:MAG: hypothetical protein ACJ71R_11410 [Nitrososphaeraceae archaeon]
MMIITMTMMTSISTYGYKKAFAILLIIISVSILMIIGVANAVYNTPIANPTLQNQRSYDQCASAHALHIKMFDSQTVPKYIIGKDYKITPVSPTTTDVLINRCSLAAEGISQ